MWSICTMGKAAVVATYELVKAYEDVELVGLLADRRISRSEPARVVPRRHMSREHYRKLKHYAVYSVLVVIALVMQMNYLAYKLYIYFLHPGEVMRRPWLIALLLCEGVYLVTAALAAIDHVLPPSSRADLGLLDVTTSQGVPTVDILIPTCKEPTDVPVETVKAALAVDYPAGRAKVYVLDDGGDDELREFCAEAGVTYIRRAKAPKGVPHNFKCGNMNNGLQHADGEYVVMMDADMVLHPSYLRRVLPHIVNSIDVAFVQIPQAFYNLPVGDPLNDSCTLGYDRILTNRDTLGTASCVGTGALFRRSTLDEIGGFQPQSITEDTMTAYTLFNRGYESVYLNYKLQIGLTPWTFEGYVKQRTRWGKGAIQQYAASWRSCLGKHSQRNFLQKLFYFFHTGYYFVSFINALLMTLFLSALAFHWQLSVGTEEQNLALIKHLTLYLVSARFAWFAIFLDLPQSVLMRNREESHFWWMTPYFLQMCVESLRDFKSTSVFIPTSNIDNAAEGSSTSGGLAPPKSLSQLSLRRLNIPHSWTIFATQVNQLKWHLGFVTVSGLVVIGRGLHAMESRDCGETFLALGLSLFLISISAHMLVPVAFVFFPSKMKASERKSLIRFSADGVPQFNPDVDCVPKWSWNVISYEILAWINLIFWGTVLVFTIQYPGGSSGSNFLHSWCKAHR